MTFDKPYSRGVFNVVDGEYQVIRLSEGCPNGCPYCRETKECGKDPVWFPIPEIVKNKVRILDMNIIYKPNSLNVINFLGEQRVNKKVVEYELVCGVDYRYLTQEKANALFKNRFKKIRIAWDWGYDQQFRIKDALHLLIKAGYKPKDLSVFVLCNWKIPYSTCLKKLDLLKIWGVKINDCWFDNQLSPNIKPIYWKPEEIKDFRAKARKHNQLVLFGVDPEYKDIGEQLSLLKEGGV